MRKDEFSEEVRRIRPHLLSLARKYSRSPDDAEDAVQDTLVCTWEAIRRGVVIRSMRAYMSTVLKFRCIRVRMNEANRQRLAPTIAIGEFIDDIAAGGEVSLFGTAEEARAYKNDLILTGHLYVEAVRITEELI